MKIDSKLILKEGVILKAETRNSNGSTLSYNTNNMEQTILDKIAKTVSQLSFMDIGVFTLELSEDTMIFTISLKNGDKAFVRHHLYDDVLDHDTSMSYFKGKVMETNAVAQFDEIIKYLKNTAL